MRIVAGPSADPTGNKIKYVQNDKINYTIKQHKEPGARPVAARGEGCGGSWKLCTGEEKLIVMY